jgi:hypothetical protein
VDGDAGAPLEAAEATILENIYPIIKPYLRKESIEAIEMQGTHVVTEDGELETPLINGADCADVIFDEKNTALYPFGYGLSYTTFEYRNLKLDKSSMEVGETLTVSVDVINNGSRDGHEVVQLYIRDLFGSVTRPVKELKGFEKVLLKAGETKTVTFKLTNAELGFYGQGAKYVVESGDFKIFVGGNSVDLMEADFELK